jgi:NAD(P)-dependent dehydrogenase (short-subunit alcohol dehydrogenase family)
MHTLTVGLSRAYAPHVRVNAIMPGVFRTDIVKDWSPEALERLATKRIPMKRIGRPNEIVGAAMYLASQTSGYTTGSVLKVDRGYAYATS